MQELLRSGPQAPAMFASAARSVSRVLGFAAWTSGVVHSHRLAARFDEELRTPRGKRQFIAAWSRGVLLLLGLDLRIVGGQLRDQPGVSYLVISNHRSPLDVFVCVHLVGGTVLSHRGVSDYPVFGTAARATDTIFVDRADQRSGAQAIRQMRRHLEERRNVIVFPEGTTFRGDRVRPFKRGSFVAAKGLSHVRVLPLGVAYEPGSEFVGETFGSHLMRMCARRVTPIWVVVGDPQPVPRTPAEEEALRAYVQGLVDRAARARDQP